MVQPTSIEDHAVPSPSQEQGHNEKDQHLAARPGGCSLSAGRQHNGCTVRADHSLSLVSGSELVFGATSGLSYGEAPCHAKLIFSCEGVEKTS